MLSFKKNVQTNHIRNLFEGSEFQIRKSHSELGVQLADFIAGTLGHIFDKHKKSDESNKFLKLLSNKLISINHFPKEYNASEFSENELYSEFDETISVVSLKKKSTS